MSRPPTDVRDPKSHLSIEDLAILAEGGAAKEAMPDAVQHLSQCRSCMAAYADAVRYRAAWLACPDDFRAPRALTNEGLVADRSSRRSPLEVAVWVGAVFLITIGVGLATFRPWRPSPDQGKFPEAVRELLANASSEGLVFPGGEAGAAGEGPAYRAHPARPEDPTEALETLRGQIEGGDRSIDRLYALSAGLIAMGRIDLATDYLGEARTRAPHDHRFAVLAAMVASARGESADAENLLLRARQIAPRDPVVALNLGIIVGQTRGLNDARPYLLEATERAPGSPVAQRARQMLDGSPSR